MIRQLIAQSLLGPNQGCQINVQEQRIRQSVTSKHQSKYVLDVRWALRLWIDFNIIWDPFFAYHWNVMRFVIVFRVKNSVRCVVNDYEANQMAALNMTGSV